MRRAPATLTHRYAALRERALSRGELGRYLVTFLDNHDQVGQQYKRRFGAGARPEQVVAAIGYLICALGTPCIYYGTEQGFSGEGTSEESIREAMFDLDDPGRNFLNKDCTIYREVAAIAGVNRSHPALRFGRMYFREVSGDGYSFGMPSGQPCTLAFSRILAGEEVLVAYNTSTDQPRSDCVAVDSALHPPGSTVTFLYGGDGEVAVQAHRHPGNSTAFVHLQLAPMQFVILGRPVDAG